MLIVLISHKLHWIRTAKTWRIVSFISTVISTFVLAFLPQFYSCLIEPSQLASWEHHTSFPHCYFTCLFYLVLPQEPISQPCVPSPCGPYSQCRVVNGHAVCSCQTDYIGTPPACRPECMVSADCPQDKACINTKCKDPCPGTCGLNARCNVVNHNPICSCPVGFNGDPFVRCLQEESKETFRDSGFALSCSLTSIGLTWIVVRQSNL